MKKLFLATLALIALSAAAQAAPVCPADYQAELDVKVKTAVAASFPLAMAKTFNKPAKPEFVALFDASVDAFMAHADLSLTVCEGVDAAALEKAKQEALVKFNAIK